MESSATPALLPLFRSRQQAELLAFLLDRQDEERSLTELSDQLRIPLASVHREVARAQQAGIVRSRNVGRTRLISAEVQSPYFEPLRQLLVIAFGPPLRLGRALASIPGIDAAYLFGSWAARYEGVESTRPVGDLDLLVLGTPDRDQVYAALRGAELELGREIQVTIRSTDWLDTGSGSFHDTVVSRPLVPVPIPA